MKCGVAGTTLHIPYFDLYFINFSTWCEVLYAVWFACSPDLMDALYPNFDITCATSFSKKLRILFFGS